MRAGDLRAGSLPNLYSFARDNRDELKNPRLSRPERARLIVETAALRRRMWSRISRRLVTYGPPVPVSRQQRGAQHGRT